MFSCFWHMESWKLFLRLFFPALLLLLSTLWLHILGFLLFLWAYCFTFYDSLVTRLAAFDFALLAFSLFPGFSFLVPFSLFAFTCAVAAATSTEYLCGNCGDALFIHCCCWCCCRCKYFIIACFRLGTKNGENNVRHTHTYALPFTSTCIRAHI